jgi:hypothetical protein
MLKSFRNWRAARASHKIFLRDYTQCRACGNAHRKAESCGRCAELRREENEAALEKQKAIELQARFRDAFSELGRRHAALDAREQAVAAKEAQQADSAARKKK